MAHVYANNELVDMLMYGECHQVAAEASRNNNLTPGPDYTIFKCRSGSGDRAGPFNKTPSNPPVLEDFVEIVGYNRVRGNGQARLAVTLSSCGFIVAVVETLEHIYSKVIVIKQKWHMYARPHHMLQTEEEVLDIVEDDSSTSTREIARQVNVSRHKVWKTLRENQLYPFHNNLTPGPDYTIFKCRS
ncbi:hypothetical protein NQ317_010643 [Molorchus minor]|uniref:Uncharacterized protein n=1 Tax=Molorchus minor TaxID=1323400 RepID=A0ABQ9J2F7_9CUCU|nr:hypothetical protein NQ317_010643 [Molorchus minor]